VLQPETTVDESELICAADIYDMDMFYIPLWKRRVATMSFDTGPPYT
jgi:hypothetical protein